MVVPRAIAPYHRAPYEPVTSAWLSSIASRLGGPALDVGAYVGHYSLLLSEAIGPHGQVWAVEPSPRNRALLDRNLAMNGAHNVRVLPVAAGATASERTFRVVELGDQDGFFEAPRTKLLHTLQVRQVVLDDEVDDVRVAKIDAEGAEIDVLDGMARMIAPSNPRRPHLAVEWAPHVQEAAGRAPLDLIDYLGDHGYEITVLADASHRHLDLDTALREYREGRFDGFVNLAAVPR